MKLLAALALVLVLATPAPATLITSASIDGGAPIFAIDNVGINTCGSPVIGPCQLPDLNAAVGVLALGPQTLSPGLDVQFVVNTSDAGAINRLDSVGTQFTNTDAVAHTFAVAVGATDFLGPALQAFTTGAGQWSTLSGNYAGSFITMRWFNDPGNVQGALLPFAIQPGNLIDSLLDVAGPANPDSFSHNGLAVVSDPDLFSMTVQFEGLIGPGVRLTGREQTILKPQAVVVTQASTLMLVGAGVVGAAVWARRRTR